MTDYSRYEVERQPMRADFVSEVVSFDEQTRIAQFRMLPDPRRYDKIEENGKTLYLDKYLHTAFALEVLASGMRPGLPSYALSSSIGSTADYASDRLSALEHELGGGEYQPPKEKALAHSELAPEDRERSLGFISVDICGATAFRNRDASAFDQAYDIFIRELATIVGQFNGSVLKTKGDGFIAYVDHPSFVNLCDAVIDMGLSILYVLHKSINPTLREAELPLFNVRIGADYGSAIIRQVRVPTTGFSSLDVASDALNRAVKIEEACQINEFRIGRSLYELIHVQWLERATEVEFESASVGLTEYKTYRMQ
jgi:class 3 adenylate cyclase